MADYIYSMETRLTPDQQRGVNQVQEIAQRAGLNLYLTGGTIRDLVTGFPIRDLDLSVQGNPLKLQRELEKAGISVQGADDELRTLHLLMPGNIRAELNMTRAEIHDKPGKSPAITPATINEDLRRRDFTVNAMALSLNPGSRGLLLDPFNGIADIETKVLRVLHNYAFLEEPVRLLRATRFSARFHWPLEERTQARYNAAKENNYIEYIGKPAVGYELEQLAHEDDPLPALRALDKEGWLKVLHPRWSLARIDAGELGHVVKMRQMMNDLGYSVETGPIVMHFLTRRMNDKDVSDIQRMIPRRDFVDKWKHLERGARDLTKKLTSKEAATASGSWKILTDTAPEDIMFLSLTVRQKAVDQKLKNFFGKWRQMKGKLPFPEMAELRITPQLPEYQKILDQAFLLLLDGRLRSHSDIMHFLKPYEPPPPPPPPAVKRGRAKAVAGVTPASGAPAVTTGVPGSAAATAKRGRKAKGATSAAPTAASPAMIPAGPTPAVSTAPAAPTARPVPAGKKPAASVPLAVPLPAGKAAAPPPLQTTQPRVVLPAKKATPARVTRAAATAKRGAAVVAHKKAAQAPARKALTRKRATTRLTKKSRPATKTPSRKAKKAKLAARKPAQRKKPAAKKAAGRRSAAKKAAAKKAAAKRTPKKRRKR